ncbi:helix-turn-helix transcriptional regulator [Amycolatopsis rhabdoformis]|uniref:Helix-turn-helix transcriptional regulator n=1 Tax=Amycolatopsis rhabdoformis TaxID=1448059 RepID=A0ABZ1I6E1_9PSEU|nr:helix-turn-helix transcriptional regulator [Amycolatopsis rhabdoformis]WSE29059.1 helix-turn-helix transcriptional regulator [Amycolatopsis rhabdoformis]
MANDRLRTAMLAANLDVHSLAGKVGVDWKTVDRWIGKERVPHRSTRQKVVAVLGGREEDLWPSLAADSRPAQSESELVHLYESRSAITGAAWEALLSGVQYSMDVLVFSGAFLVEQYNFIPLVRQKAKAGVRFRLLVGDEAAQAVVQRAVEERTPGGLEGRVQLMRRYLADVVDLDGVEVRTHGEILYNSLYRFDDDLLVNGHAFGALAGQSPVMHLQRRPDGHMWEHYMRSFERTWDLGVPEKA